MEEAALLTRFAPLFPAPAAPAAPASSQSPTSPGLHITVVAHTEPAEAALTEAQSRAAAPTTLSSSASVPTGARTALDRHRSEPLLQRCPGSVLILRARKS